MAFLSGYTTRKKITIDKDKIDSNLTDFPVLVKLTSSNFDFSKANSDGYDIRFTSSDGTTLLKYERERHDATNKLAEYWVKIPSISSSVDTDFYIYYRTADTDDGSDKTNVWDNNFKGVWHLKDNTTSQVLDSTSNNNNGTKKEANKPLETDGKIGKAQDFDLAYINFGSSSSLKPTTGITLEILVKSDNTTPQLFSNRNGSGSNNYQIFYDGGYYNCLFWGLTSTSVTSTTAIDTTKWQYVVFVYDGSYIRCYIDGEAAGVQSSTGSINSGSGELKIGEDWYGHYHNGKHDEARLSSIGRNAAWIKASYNSGNNSLVSYGTEEGMDNAIFFGINL